MALKHASGKTPASLSPRKGARLIGVGGPAEVIPHHSANELLPCIFCRRGGGRNKRAPFLPARKSRNRAGRAKAPPRPPALAAACQRAGARDPASTPRRHYCACPFLGPLLKLVELGLGMRRCPLHLTGVTVLFSEEKSPGSYGSLERLVPFQFFCSINWFATLKHYLCFFKNRVQFSVALQKCKMRVRSFIMDAQDARTHGHPQILLHYLRKLLPRAVIRSSDFCLFVC